MKRKDKAAQHLARLANASRTPEERIALARKAAQARWAKQKAVRNEPLISKAEELFSLLEGGQN
jgi:hypothetical protein